MNYNKTKISLNNDNYGGLSKSPTNFNENNNLNKNNNFPVFSSNSRKRKI